MFPVLGTTGNAIRGVFFLFEKEMPMKLLLHVDKKPMKSETLEKGKVGGLKRQNTRRSRYYVVNKKP